MINTLNFEYHKISWVCRSYWHECCNVY